MILASGGLDALKYFLFFNIRWSNVFGDNLGDPDTCSSNSERAEEEEEEEEPHTNTTTAAKEEEEARQKYRIENVSQKQNTLLGICVRIPQQLASLERSSSFGRKLHRESSISLSPPATADADLMRAD